MQCLANTFVPGRDPDIGSLVFPGSEPELSQIATYGEILREVTNGSNSSFSVRAAPSSPARHSSLMVLATNTGFFFNETSDEISPAWDFETCTVDATWTKAEYNKTWTTGLTAVNADKIVEDQTLTPDLSSRVLLDTDFVEFAKEPLVMANWTVNYINKNLFAFALASALSNVAPGNGSILGLSDSTGAQRTAVKDYLGNENLDPDTETYLWTGPEPNGTEVPIFERMEVHSVRDAYGYKIDSTTVTLSIVVLLIYCIIAILHVVHGIATGRAGSSWNTVSELFMLALNTQPPSHIQNTSAGVNTFSTFREPVKVRANKHGSLEVVFLDDPAQSSLDIEDVKPNEAY